jgi:hypothetical protein
MRGKFKVLGTYLHCRVNSSKGYGVLLKEIQNAKVVASLFFPRENFQRENSSNFGRDRFLGGEIANL